MLTTAAKQPPESDQTAPLSNLWLFEKNKLLILQALYQCQNHLCGTDFIDHLNVPKNLVSYHMKLLREQGYVIENPAGRQKQYQLHPAKVQEVQSILTLVHLLPEAPRNTKQPQQKQ